VSGNGVRISATVRGGRLGRLAVRDSQNKETVVGADLPVLEVGPELFEGLPLDDTFKIKIRRS